MLLDGSECCGSTYVLVTYSWNGPYWRLAEIYHQLRKEQLERYDHDDRRRLASERGVCTRSQDKSQLVLFGYLLSELTFIEFLKVFYNVRDKEGLSHPLGQEEYGPNGPSK